MAGTDTKAFCARLIQDLLRVLHRLGEGLLYIDVASGLDRHAGQRSMGGRRGNDVHHIETFRGKQLLRRLETADARNNIAHRRLSRIGGVGHRHQLHAGAAQNSAGMMLGMTACTDERDP
jgi:hypothetical protein